MDPRIALLDELRKGKPQVPNMPLVARPFAAVEVTLEDGNTVFGNALGFGYRYSDVLVAVWFPQPGQITVKGKQVRPL